MKPTTIVAIIVVIIVLITWSLLQVIKVDQLSPAPPQQIPQPSQSSSAPRPELRNIGEFYRFLKQMSISFPSMLRGSHTESELLERKIHFRCNLKRWFNNLTPKIILHENWRDWNSDDVCDWILGLHYFGICTNVLIQR